MACHLLDAAAGGDVPEVDGKVGRYRKVMSEMYDKEGDTKSYRHLRDVGRRDSRQAM